MHKNREKLIFFHFIFFISKRFIKEEFEDYFYFNTSKKNTNKDD